MVSGVGSWCCTLWAVIWTAISASLTAVSTSAITTVSTIAAVTTVVAVSTIRTWFAVVFLFVNPAFHTDDSVNGASFSEAVVERDAEGLEGYFAFAVALGAGDVSTTEATGATDADAFGTEFHGGLQGAFHGAAEGNPALKLDGDLLGDKLRIELRLANLEDVELHLRIFADLADFGGHDLDFLALTTDDEAGTGRMKGDADAVPGALNDNTGEAGVLELLPEVGADGKILVEFLGIVLADGIRFGAPVLVDGEAEGDRIYFLAQGVRWRV